MKKIGLLMIVVILCLSGCSAKDNVYDSKETASKEESKSAEISRQVTIDEPRASAEKESMEIKVTNGNNEKCTVIFGDSLDADYNNLQLTSEEYTQSYESGFIMTNQMPLSTFSVDVDTASYSQIRRYLSRENQLPPTEAVRIEEMINYFDYDYKRPTGKDPFTVYTEMGVCPWNPEHYLAMIGLQGEEVAKSKRVASNLVFLLDVSGSMNDPYKLPLLQSAFTMLTNELTSKDNVSIVVYAGASGVILEGAEGIDKKQIEDAIYSLSAGGSTAGGEGIELAYKLAKKYYIKGGNNRVILATDGDFNVGISSLPELEDFIVEKRDEDIFLSVLGFGTGNIKDSTMELLADKGNGNYAYIDSNREAEKVLVNEMAGTLYTIAKDVKLQVEFNPGNVGAYRLVGYDNRRLNNEDFIDDKKDAGDIGMGHQVTAFYEIIPVDQLAQETSLRYQEKEKAVTASSKLDEWLFVKLRFKEPDEDESKERMYIVTDKYLRETNSESYNFAAAVAEAGLLLKDSQFKENASWESVIRRARENTGKDKEGYRSEFIHLMEIAKYNYR